MELNLYFKIILVVSKKSANIKTIGIQRNKKVRL